MTSGRGEPRRRASWRRALELAEDRDDPAEDLALRVHLERIERGRSPGRASTLPLGRFSRLTVASSSAGPGRSAATTSPSSAVSAPDDHDVAVEDPGADHRVARDAQREVLRVAREPHRDDEVVLDVLRRPGPARPRRSARRAGRRRPRARLASDSAMARGLVGSFRRWPRRSSVRELRMHARGRGQPDRLADLAHGGGVAPRRARSRR